MSELAGPLNHAFVVVPVARDVGRDIRLVLVIRRYDLDRLAKDWAKILDRHACRDTGSLPRNIRIERVHVAEHADLHLRRCGGRSQRQQDG
jgi:hypothetical protein